MTPAPGALRSPSQRKSQILVRKFILGVLGGPSLVLPPGRRAAVCGVLYMDCEEQAAVHKLSSAVSDLEREAARLQDKTGAIGDIQRSLLTIASAWHACLDRAAWSSAPDTQ